MRKNEEVAFISNDINAFSTKRGLSKLHSDLEEDINNALLVNNANSFYYHESFADFLASHYLPIKGIDSSSIRNFIAEGGSDFGNNLLGWIIENKENFIKGISSINSEYKIELDFEEFNINEILDINDFYIYFRKEEIVFASGEIVVYADASVYFKTSYITQRKHVLKLNLDVKVTANYEKRKTH